jgi:hypothetical protein
MGVVALFLAINYSLSPFVSQIELPLSCPHLDKMEVIPEIPHHEGGFLPYFFPLEVSSFLPPS